MNPRLLLLPFSALYGLVVSLRRQLYSCGLRSSRRSTLPVICVGNITVGGTGKTPLIELLLSLLAERRTAVVSRGYGRKTKGQRLVDTADTAEQVGDEPLQIKRHFPQTTVIVNADRNEAIKLLESARSTDVVLMDDGLQHLSTSPSLRIVVCDYARPFWQDHLLPAGNLRECPSTLSHADIVLINKCPTNLSQAEADNITEHIGLYTTAPTFFSVIDYDSPKLVRGSAVSNSDNIIALCGIGRSRPFFEAVEAQYANVVRLDYPDHHAYTPSDIQKIVSLTRDGQLPIICTEKDLTRLPDLQGNTVYTLPIKLRILFDTESKFNSLIINHINTFNTHG